MFKGTAIGLQIELWFQYQKEGIVSV